MNLLVTGTAGFIGPRLPTRATAGLGARVVHLSPDHVLSGEARATAHPEDHRPVPRTAYGRTELAGEHAVPRKLPGASVVPRTAWLYGVHGRSFVRTTTELEARRDTVDVVDDQRGQPIWSADAAERIAGLGPRIGRDASGVPHATSSGETTWYDWSARCSSASGPARTGCTRSAARPSSGPRLRPAYRALAHGRRQSLGLPPPREGRSALHEALPRIRKESPA
ncbi:SDR family oxidoreductase [Streptomyces sp. NPDC050287]|uniref:SDR family oxidoreductase n=1 Tax=Streptomyces sp. NPDC050287 TaxID=3365608 RepID=UPI00379B29DF